MLEIGKKIRYKQLGPGVVVDHQVRDFFGQPRQFAVIDFPQREMTVQLPIGDPIVAENISDLLSAPELHCQLADLERRQLPTLQRTWEQRRELGQQVLDQADTEGLLALFAAYSQAQGAGVTLSSSDRALLEDVRGLLAAELLLVDQQVEDFSEAEKIINRYYQQAAQRSAKRGISAENFAAWNSAQALESSSRTADKSASKRILAGQPEQQSA